MKRTTRSLIALLSGCALLLLMTKLLFLDIMVVRGDSMSPTLKEGTLIFINKLAFGIRSPFSGSYLWRWRNADRGEIIVFTNPLDGLPTLKRCFAREGDTLRVIGRDLVFGGRRLPLKYYQEGGLAPEFTVPPGALFAVGDNDAVSADSRTYGPVALERVTGAMLFPPPRRAESMGAVP